MLPKSQGIAGAVAIMAFGAIAVAGLSNQPDQSKPASDQSARDWAIERLDTNHVLARAQVEGCMAAGNCAAPASARADAKMAPAPEMGPDGIYTLRYTNPADTDFCNRSEVRGNLYWAAARVTQRPDVQVRSIEAGQNFCQSNDPDACKVDPASHDHVCHAVLALPDAGTLAGNFYVNQDDALKTTFRSDAQLKADGQLN